MARPSLGQDEAAGVSARFATRYPQSLREEIESVMLPGEDMSKFTREAWKLLIAKRKRDRAKEKCTSTKQRLRG